MSDYRWQPWLGGAMPEGLLDTDRVYVRFRDVSESKVRVASDLRWAHDNLPDDIMAWRFSHHAGE